MHSTFYMRLQVKRRWCSYSHALQICCYGNSVVAWKGIPGDALGDDKRPVTQWEINGGHYYNNSWLFSRVFFVCLGIKNQKLGRYYRYDEELVIPIIENTPFEEDLKDSMQKAIDEYPETCAVLVRRHGIYVWGDTWQQAKTM